MTTTPSSMLKEHLDEAMELEKRMIIKSIENEKIMKQLLGVLAVMSTLIKRNSLNLTSDKYTLKYLGGCVAQFIVPFIEYTNKEMEKNEPK